MMQIYPPRILKLVAIDPGSSKCGVSVFTIDFVEKKVLHIKATTLYPERLANDTGIEESSVTGLFLRCAKLKNAIMRILLDVRPDVVAYEGPFIHFDRPSAYGPLYAVMTVVHEALRDFRIGAPFEVIQPTEAKMCIGVAGSKGKEPVLNAVKAIPEIMDVLETDIDSLDDNGVDSIAIGWAYYQLHIQKSNETPPKRRKK